MGKQLYFGKQYISKLCEGINDLSKAVTVTLGPKGRTVLLENGSASELITKDGVSVARAITFEDNLKNAGASLVKEAAERTNSEAGDGTTTTVLLCSALITEGFKLIQNGFSPNEIVKAYERSSEAVLKELDKYIISFSAEDDMIKKIATVSANNDEVLGNTVAEAYSMVGDNGIVNVLDNHSKSNKTVVKLSTGINIPKAIRSGIFITDEQKSSFEADDPIIVLLLEEFAYTDLFPIIQKAVKLQRPIVLFAASFNENMAATVMSSVQQKQYKAALILNPGFEITEQINFAKDISAMTGASIIRNKSDITNLLESLNDETHYCKHISSVLRETTKIIDPNSDQSKIDERIAEIQARIKLATDDNEEGNFGLPASEISALQEEIASMSGGIATIYVGSNSTTLALEEKDRYEDAVHAVDAAIHDGVLAGGGTALLRASKVLSSKPFIKQFKNITPSLQAGINIFKDVCKLPFKTISASDDVSYQMSKILHSKSANSGFNAKTGKWSNDLVADGIIDPARVEKCAIKYATAQACAAVMSNCAVTPLSNMHIVANDIAYDRTNFKED